MSNHSPAPWKAAERMNCHAIVDANGQDLTYFPDAPSFYEGVPCGSVTSRGRTVEELQANAWITAAAPELLASVEALLNTVALNLDDTDPQDLPVIEAARAAIAKAKGE